jgi:two-component system phosphate regulon sensor histidine kinase PhoR
MKYQDKILFGLPFFAGCLVAVFALLLGWQLTRFEGSYFEDEKREIVLKTGLFAEIVRPMLDGNRVEEARNYCNEFKKNSTRLSLIAADGKVLADSGEKPELLDNHRDRPEISAAFAGTPTTSVRYSASLNAWMIYHAVRLDTASGSYVLRVAVNTGKVTGMIDMARIGIAFALLLGGSLVLGLAFYIANRVRRPMVELQNSAAAIAGGNLGTRIVTPSGGIVRELALVISQMAEQLKLQLRQVSCERNEKEAILNAMSEAVLLARPNGEVTRYNRAAAELFRIGSDARQFNLSRAGIPELLPLATRAFETGEKFEKEFELTQSGIRRTLWIKGGLLKQDDLSYLWLAIGDLTNLRKLESFRSDFIANVSHEIKTPLTCIIGAAEALQEADADNPAYAAKFLSILTAQSKRLNLLVQDILSLAALERRQMNPAADFAPVRLDSVLTNAVNMCMEKAEAGHIALTVKENPAVEIRGDFQLLEQAVVNLVNNAIKYSGSPRVEVSLVRRDDAAVITVRDYGIGIAPEHHGRIFERFYRVHQERSRQLGGTGLGLAIVKHIAQLHRGAAALESTPGQGCAFRLTLPLR